MPSEFWRDEVDVVLEREAFQAYVKAAVAQTAGEEGRDLREGDVLLVRARARLPSGAMARPEHTGAFVEACQEGIDAILDMTFRARQASKAVYTQVAEHAPPSARIDNDADRTDTIPLSTLVPSATVGQRGLDQPIDKEAVKAETSPLMTLVDAANVAQRGLEKRLSHLQLGVAQERILAFVYFAKDPLTPSMLAALLLQETHSVSGLLNRLEDRDLITRTRDRQDRRVVWVGLTAKGKKVAEEAIQISLDMAREYKSLLQGPDTDRLISTVRQVRDLGFRLAGVDEDVRLKALQRASPVT